MTCDVSSYTKFDDWPPHHRQESEALTEEAAALDVLKQYDYKIGDLKIHLLGNTALATFHIQYYHTDSLALQRLILLSLHKNNL